MKVERPRLARLGLIIIFMLTVAVGCGLYAYTTYVRSSNRVEACNTKDSVRMCVSVPKTKFAPDETVSITTTVVNTGEHDVTQMSGDCDDNPTVYVNEEVVSDALVCPAILQYTTIHAGESKKFEYKLSASKLHQDENIVYTGWAGFRSGQVTIYGE